MKLSGDDRQARDTDRLMRAAHRACHINKALGQGLRAVVVAKLDVKLWRHRREELIGLALSGARHKKGPDLCLRLIRHDLAAHRLHERLKAKA